MAPRRSTVLQAYNMKVLVIGGSGLQGAPTVRHLLAAGHAVTVLSRGSNSGAGTGGRRPVLAAGAQSLLCDRDKDGQKLTTLIIENGWVH